VATAETNETDHLEMPQTNPEKKVAYPMCPQDVALWLSKPEVLWVVCQHMAKRGGKEEGLPLVAIGSHEDTVVVKCRLSSEVTTKKPPHEDQHPPATHMLPLHTP
jgi:hypothetical protein